MASRLSREERGFTLIELLVVMVIIGVLAAIALPAFLGQQKKGQDADAKSAARSLVSHVDSCFATTEDFRDCATQAQTDATEMDWGTDPGQVSVTSTTKTTYEVVAVSAAETDGAHHTFTIERSSGTGMTRSCTAGSADHAGGCAGGDW